MEQFSSPESTYLDFESDSKEGDFPVYGADFSPVRNRLQLAKPFRLAVEYGVKFIDKSKTNNELSSKMTQGLKMVAEVQ